MALARVRCTLRRTLLVALAAAATLAGTGLPARALPTIPDIEARIDQAWNTLEPLIEQYDMIHTELTQNQARAATLADQIRPLQTQVDLTRARVGVLSASLYEYGPATQVGAMLASGTPAQLADQLTLLDHLARRQADTVADAAALVARYDTQKRPLDDLIAAQARQDADLAARKATIETQMNQLQALRQQAYGASGLVGSNTRPVACPVELTTGKGAIAARTACAQINKRYVWAAAGPNMFDCSGLTLYAWAAAGVTLRHFTQWQWQDAAPVTRDQLRPGDLVFYFRDLHHMSMYVGGGWVVHAPTSGDVVRMARLDNPYLPIAGYRRPGG